MDHKKLMGEGSQYVKGLATESRQHLKKGASRATDNGVTWLKEPGSVLSRLGIAAVITVVVVGLVVSEPWPFLPLAALGGVLVCVYFARKKEDVDEEEIGDITEEGSKEELAPSTNREKAPQGDARKAESLPAVSLSKETSAPLDDTVAPEAREEFWGLFTPNPPTHLLQETSESDERGDPEATPSTPWEEPTEDLVSESVPPSIETPAEEATHLRGRRPSV